MKHLLRFVPLIGAALCFAQAQDVTGDWLGMLSMPSGSLRLALHISKAESGLKGTLDSVDQGPKRSGSSRQDEPDRATHSMPSTIKRWSTAGRPVGGFCGGRRGRSCSQQASVRAGNPGIRRAAGGWQETNGAWSARRRR